MGPAARRATLTTLGSLRSQWHATGTLAAGSARWMLVATPVENGPLAEHHDRSGLVLFAGLVITVLVVLFLRSSIHHAHRLLRANEEISSLAHKDSLTGLDNRRAFNERLAAVGAVPLASTRAELAAYIREQSAKMAAAVKASGARPE